MLGTVGWFLIPLILSGLAIAGLVYLTGDLGLLAWPFALAATVLGFLAWRRYEAEGAEAALLRASAASILMGIAVAGIASAGDDSALSQRPAGAGGRGGRLPPSNGRLGGL